MAGMRDLLRLRVLNSSLIADLHRTALLRCYSTCLIKGNSGNQGVHRHHRAIPRQEYVRLNTTESSALNGDHVDSLPFLRRVVPKTKDEQIEMKHYPYEKPADARVLKVSILGAPNAGKSTLTNALMRWRICSVSKKVHTTRHNTKAVLVEGNTQIVFVDTPGLVSVAEKKRHNLEPAMLTDPGNSIKTADLVLVLVDVSNKYTRNSLDPKVLKILEECVNKNVALILNKIDLIKNKQTLLEIVRELTEGTVDGLATHTVIRLPKPKSLDELFKQTERALKGLDSDETVSQESDRTEPDPDSETDTTGKNLGPGWPHFQRIFMLSALKEDGLDELRGYMFRQAKLGPWMYNPTLVTDQKPEEIAILAVREKLLDHLPKEIPYNVDLEIEYWDVDAYGVLRISMLVKCPLPHQVKLIIGAQGAVVSKIAAEARQMLMNTFRCEVSLKLVVNCFSVKKK